MAIDTAEKRKSAAGVPYLPFLPGVTPDSSKDAEWRKQAAWGYSGSDTVGPGGEVEATASLTFRVSATASLQGSSKVLAINADNYLRYYGAQDSETGDYLNSGTCTYSLREEDGTELATGTLSYVSGSNGNYRGILDSADTAGLTDGERYVIVIIFDQDNYEDERRLYHRAGYRGRT